MHSQAHVKHLEMEAMIHVKSKESTKLLGSLSCDAYHLE